MDGSRLPVEVCEQIIDACYQPGRFLRTSWGHSYRTWRQTALVCVAWAPRSRLNLLHEVELREESHVDLLIRTLSEATEDYAKLVVRVSVYARKRYVPFTRAPLLTLLRNATTWNLYVDWKCYAFKYVECTPSLLQGQPIVELRIQLMPKVFSAFLRLIWSLPELQRLSIFGHSKHDSREAQKPPRADVCDNLRTLTISEVNFISQH